MRENTTDRFGEYESVYLAVAWAPALLMLGVLIHIAVHRSVAILNSEFMVGVMLGVLGMHLAIPITDLSHRVANKLDKMQN